MKQKQDDLFEVWNVKPTAIYCPFFLFDVAGLNCIQIWNNYASWIFLLYSRYCIKNNPRKTRYFFDSIYIVFLLCGAVLVLDFNGVYWDGFQVFDTNGEKELSVSLKFLVRTILFGEAFVRYPP